MRLFYILNMIFIVSRVFSQAPVVENYRHLGYIARMNGLTDSSIHYYSKVLEINPDDYDARLALARLYFNSENYDKAKMYYQEIFSDDSTDAEALLGFGRIYLRTGEFVKSGSYFDHALKPEPPYIPYYFDRARSLIYQDKLDSAVLVYQQILEIDKTVAEAWAGIGKMYYWQNKPFSALLNYEKALSLDPGNEDYLKVFNNLKTEIAWQTTYSLRSIMEKEESYRIDAILNTLSTSKRLSNTFQISASLLLDQSNKQYSWQTTDTTRWFNNFRFSAMYLGKKNRLNVYAGYSFSDEVFSSYGAYYTAVWRIKSFKFYNSTAIGYSYFYYWNKVGQDYFSDNLAIVRKKITYGANFRYGVVRENTIADYEHQKYDIDKNPYYNYSFSFQYKPLTEPSLSFAVNYSFMDFKFKSPLYYTPKNRNLAGLSIGFYHSLSKFYIYLAGGYNLGREVYYEESSTIPGTLSERIINVDNKNWESEVGYTLKKIGFSFGSSGFNNPYYSNRIFYFSIKSNL